MDSNSNHSSSSAESGPVATGTVNSVVPSTTATTTMAGNGSIQYSGYNQAQFSVPFPTGHLLAPPFHNPYQSYSTPPQYFYQQQFPQPQQSFSASATMTTSTSTPKNTKKKEPVQKNRVGRPRKAAEKRKKYIDDDADDPDYDPEVSNGQEEKESPSLQVPPHSMDDVCIPAGGGSCVDCEYWMGRYILEPCMHFAFCRACINKLHCQAVQVGAKPRCPACHTPITAYQPGIRSTIFDVSM